MAWYIVAVALACGALIAAGAVLIVRRGLKAVAPAAPAAALARLEVELAVLRERAGRIPGLERERDEARAESAEARRGRSDLEQQQAAAAATRTQDQSVLEDLRARLAALDGQRRADVAAAAEHAAVLQSELTGAEKDRAALREALAQERRRAEEKLALLGEAKEAMTQQFKLLSNELMAQHGETFAKQNQVQLDGLLTPLRDKLKDFQDGLQKAHEETGKDRAVLAEQIRALSEQSARMSSETVNLTKALKGSAQLQGAWGEMLLESLLERSGLREGEEYQRQTSHSTEEGRRLRTDVVVHLPGGQHVIIDSKVSLAAFEAHVNAETDAEREQRLGAHLASMRAHIKTLSRKEYHAATGGGLDYVIMFVPIEGALAAALQKDPELTSYAVQANVAIATPTTLMIALRTIDNVWKVERRNRNAEAIAERAGLLYGKFVSFVEDLQDVGKRLGQAQTSHESAMAKLHAGPGNLIGQTEKLRGLGAKTTKVLPESVLIGSATGPDAT